MCGEFQTLKDLLLLALLQLPTLVLSLGICCPRSSLLQRVTLSQVFAVSSAPSWVKAEARCPGWDLLPGWRPPIFAVRSPQPLK